MENIIGVVVWIVIILIYVFTKTNKKNNKPTTTPKKSNSDEKISSLIQELVSTQKQNKSYEDIYGDDEARSLEVMKPETHSSNLSETFKSQVAQNNLKKEENLANKRDTQNEVVNEYQEFIQNPDNLRKAFILKEIFDRKF